MARDEPRRAPERDLGAVLAQERREVALERGELPAGLDGVEADELLQERTRSSSEAAMCGDAASSAVQRLARGAVEARARQLGRGTRTRAAPRAPADGVGEHAGGRGRDVGHPPLRPWSARGVTTRAIGWPS